MARVIDTADTPERFTKGDYQVSVVVNSGTVTLEQSLENQTFEMIPGATWTAGDKFVLTIGSSRLQMTGDGAITFAEVFK